MTVSSKRLENDLLSQSYDRRFFPGALPARPGGSNPEQDENQKAIKRVGWLSD